MTDPDVKAHWEDRYAQRPRIWSGRVNHWLGRMAESMPPERALDLGCGEGGDSLWLAEKGWDVVGVDISDTALERARADADERGLTYRVRFVQANLSESFPEGVFDLVSAQFLQSMVHLDRERIFAAAARAVAPGGTLIVVDHGAAPPWAAAVAGLHDHVFPTVDEVLATIALDGQWEQLHAGAVERAAVGPDGQEGMLLDNLIVLRSVVGGGGVVPCGGG